MAQEKQKAWKKLLESLGGGLIDNLKRKATLNGQGRGSPRYAKKRSPGFPWRPSRYLTLRSSPFSHHMHYPLRNNNSIVTSSRTRGSSLVLMIGLRPAFIEIPRGNCLCGDSVHACFYRGNLTLRWTRPMHTPLWFLYLVLVTHVTSRLLEATRLQL